MKPLYKEKYPHIFEPLTVGRGENKVTYKNRIFAAPMLSQLGSYGDGIINDIGIENYGDMARGGFASICMPTEIPQGGGHPRSIILDDDLIPFQDVHMMQRLVHAFGCKTSCEIYHPGCMQRVNADYVALAPSSFKMNGFMTKEMDEDDMHKVCAMYERAAFSAKRAGFDIISLMFGQGCLINNFLSPLSNHRTDKFGGSVENRCRFPLMVIESIRRGAGDMPIELRLNGNEYTPGGILPEDAVEQAKIFAEVVDMIHITCGTRMTSESRPMMFPSNYIKPGHNTAVSAMVKKANVKIPIGVVGAIHTPEFAEQVLAEGRADYILMGRQVHVDMNWVNKVKEGREEDIRPCLRCNYCFDVGRRAPKSKSVAFGTSAETNYNVICVINPYFQQGIVRRKIPMPVHKKTIAVIGGGPAGLQAALTAAERGHEVYLYEQSDRLGGQLNIFADHERFKKEVAKYRDYMIRQVEKKGVNILLNTKATRDMIEQLDPDAVIVAVGAEQIVPAIPGVENSNVYMAADIFGKEDELGPKVVIIGGGMVGCEISIHLGEKGHQCTVVEMGEYIAGNAQLSQRIHILKFMEESKVVGLPETKCTKITEQGVYVVDADNQEKFLEADSVIICVGNKAKTIERDVFKDVAFDVINVGDCVKAGDIRTAVHSAWDAAATLGLEDLRIHN